MSSPTAILGATGACGIQIARELASRGVPVRVVSRSEARLRSVFGEANAEIVAADLSRPTAAQEALAGCDRAFLCVGLPVDQMHVHPVIAECVAKAARNEGVRCVQLSSCWSYLPLQHVPLDETHPREGGPPWGQYRRDAEAVLQEAGACVLNLPDLFGPLLREGVLQRSLIEVARGHGLHWVGDGDNERDFLYVPDAAMAAIAVSEHEQAYGQRWIVPGSGAIDGAGLAALLGELCGRTVRFQPAGVTKLRLYSLFSEELRAFQSLVPEYVKTIRYDGSRLTALLGGHEPTDYRTALRATLDWLQQ